MFKTKSFLIVMTLLLVSASPVMASEVTGNLSTGLNSTVGSTLQGTVVSRVSGGGSVANMQTAGAKTFNVPPDANGDGRTDVLDFVSLMANWGKLTTNRQGDFNNDGNVDIFDFVSLMANWTR